MRSTNMKENVERSLRSHLPEKSRGEASGGNMSVSRHKKTASHAVISIRTIAALCGAALVCHTYYYGRNTARTYRSALNTSNLDYYYSRAVSYSKSLPATSLDSKIFPHQFQQLKEKQFSISRPVNDSWLTLEERLQIEKEFRRHNRESIYSLLLLPSPHDNDDDDYDYDDDDNDDRIVNSETVLQWGNDFDYLLEHGHKRHDQGLYEFHSLWGLGMEEEDAKKHRNDPRVLSAAWTSGSKKPRLIHEHNICHAFRHARDIAQFNTPHVLLTHLNENWGTLSSYVPSRTHDWGDILEHWGKLDGSPCDPLEVQEFYLNSPQTLAVFTTQHQALFNHPKVHSIPIGVANAPDGGEAMLRRLSKQKRQNQKKNSANKSLSNNSRRNLRNKDIRERGGKIEQHKSFADNSTSIRSSYRKLKSRLNNSRPQFLMINASPSPTRKPQIDAVIRNFENSGHPQGKGIKNMYEQYEGTWEQQRDQYYDDMSNSKFILCPSGIGYDTYRAWESIAMGAIPVMERHKYTYKIITFPASSGNRPKLISLEEASQKGLQEKLQKQNATLETIEYYDGWQKSFDDLPVVWIDGEFGDEAPKQGKKKGNYLTPQFLEDQYDELALREGNFRYEKLTSLYWIQFMESFLLKNNDNDNDELWNRAMSSLSSTFNNHTVSVEEFMTMSKDSHNHKLHQVEGEEQQQQQEDDYRSNYLFGSYQPVVLSWVLFIELKVAGILSVVIAIRRWNVSKTSDNGN